MRLLVGAERDLGGRAASARPRRRAARGRACGAQANVVNRELSHLQNSITVNALITMSI